MKEKLKVMNDNELIINNDTKLSTIKNKNNYSKLIIEKKIKPVFLNNFKNVKELIIDNNYYIEGRLNKLSFKDNVEKVIIKNIRVLGIKDDRSGFGYVKYSMPFPNLKVLELPNNIHEISGKYLNETKKLETIIFNVSSATQLDTSDSTIALPPSLKNIVIKTEYNTHNINLDYTPSDLKELNFYSSGIKLCYYNDFINTECYIDNNVLNITNSLTSINDNLVIDKCLYIPDYINDINIKEKKALKEIDSISVNPQRLNLYDSYKSTRLFSYLNNINKIIIRSNNEMKLNPDIELATEEYGKIIDLYIKNKKMNIEFSNSKITVDEVGNIEKIKESKLENNKNQSIERIKEDNILNNYNSVQLEYYTYFKKLLELLNDEDKELDDAMNIVNDRLVKKLQLKE